MLTSSVLTVFYFCMWCRKNRISISILHQSLKFWFPWQPYHTHRRTHSQLQREPEFNLLGVTGSYSPPSLMQGGHPSSSSSQREKTDVPLQPTGSPWTPQPVQHLDHVLHNDRLKSTRCQCTKAWNLHYLHVEPSWANCDRPPSEHLSPRESRLDWKEWEEEI